MGKDIRDELFTRPARSSESHPRAANPIVDAMAVGNRTGFLFSPNAPVWAKYSIGH